MVYLKCHFLVWSAVARRVAPYPVVAHFPVDYVNTSSEIEIYPVKSELGKTKTGLSVFTTFDCV